MKPSPQVRTAAITRSDFPYRDRQGAASREPVGRAITRRFPSNTRSAIRPEFTKQTEGATYKPYIPDGPPPVPGR